MTPSAMSFRRALLAGLLAGAAALRAAVTVTAVPARETIPSGGSCPIQVTVAGTPDPAVLFDVEEVGRGAYVDPSGVFRAPVVAAATAFHIRVQSVADPGVVAVAVIRVEPPSPGGESERKAPPVDFLGLPRDPLGLVAGFAPEMKPLAAGPLTGMPFLDPVTGARWTEAPIRRDSSIHDLAVWVRSTPFGGVPVAGLGVPLQVRWPVWPGASAQLLTTLDPTRAETGVTYQDAGPGQAAQLTLFRPAEVMVESLSPARGGGFDSHRSMADIPVRGLRLLAGLPGDAGAAAGILWEDWSLFTEPREALVTDPGRNVLRRVHRDGTVEPAFGDPQGSAGYRNDAETAARFNHPTHLARGPHSGMVLVADSGNNVIRVVEGRWAYLFAGRPGVHPFADGPATEASFRNPQGLAVSPAHGIFVADQGFCVVRQLRPRHEPMSRRPSWVVHTFAGTPGERGIGDGLGAGARFWDLRGLAESHGGLWVLDGNALRRIRWDGQVETVAGSVLRPGFQDQGWPGATGSVGEPCFNDPQDLVYVHPGLIYVADTGNHAIREVDLRQARSALGDDLDPARVRVRTLAGDRDRPWFGAGLFKDALGHFPAAGYATLAAPRALCWAETHHRSTLDLAVAAGDGIAELGCVRGLQDFPSGLKAAPVVQVYPAAPAQGEAYRIGFAVPPHPGALNHPGPAPGWDYQYTVEVLGPGGQPLGEPRTGLGSFTRATRIPGIPFPDQGAGTVVVRYVTVQGFSADTVRTVVVGPPRAAGAAPER